MQFYCNRLLRGRRLGLIRIVRVGAGVFAFHVAGQNESRSGNRGGVQRFGQLFTSESRGNLQGGRPKECVGCDCDPQPPKQRPDPKPR